MAWTRRRFIGSAFGAIALVGGGVTGWFGWTRRYLLRLISGRPPAPEGPRESDVGTLSEADTDTLWHLFEAIRVNWRMPEVSKGELLEFLTLKTSQPPSYLREYREAAESFRAARAGAADDASALRRMLAASSEEVEGQLPPAAYTKDLVIREMIRLHLSRGGYRRFGLQNGPGFFGGPAGYRQARSG